MACQNRERIIDREPIESSGVGGVEGWRDWAKSKKERERRHGHGHGQCGDSGKNEGHGWRWKRT